MIKPKAMREIDMCLAERLMYFVLINRTPHPVKCGFQFFTVLVVGYVPDRVSAGFPCAPRTPICINQSCRHKYCDLSCLMVEVVTTKRCTQ